MVMARRKNLSTCHKQKINSYLWALALYEHVVGDGEATLLFLTLTMSLRRSLTESLDKLSMEMRSLSLLSLVYSCISFERCCKGWIRLMNQHVARSKPVKP